MASSCTSMCGGLLSFRPDRVSMYDQRPSFPISHCLPSPHRDPGRRFPGVARDCERLCHSAVNRAASAVSYVAFDSLTAGR